MLAPVKENHLLGLLVGVTAVCSIPAFKLELELGKRLYQQKVKKQEERDREEGSEWKSVHTAANSALEGDETSSVEFHGDRQVDENTLDTLSEQVSREERRQEAETVRFWNGRRVDTKEWPTPRP